MSTVSVPGPGPRWPFLAIAPRTSSTPAAALCFNRMQRMCPGIARLKKVCVPPRHLEPSRVLSYVKATRLFRQKIVQHLLSA